MKTKKCLNKNGMIRWKQAMPTAMTCRQVGRHHPWSDNCQRRAYQLTINLHCQFEALVIENQPCNAPVHPWNGSPKPRTCLFEFESTIFFCDRMNFMARIGGSNFASANGAWRL